MFDKSPFLHNAVKKARRYAASLFYTEPNNVNSAPVCDIIPFRGTYIKSLVKVRKRYLLWLRLGRLLYSSYTPQ